MESRTIPKFANEEEEAKWWFDHREEVARDIVEASQAGKLGEGSRARFLRKTKEMEQPTSTRTLASIRK